LGRREAGSFIARPTSGEGGNFGRYLQPAGSSVSTPTVWDVGADVGRFSVAPAVGIFSAAGLRQDCLPPSVGTSARKVEAGEGMRICVIGLRGVPNVIGGIETHCEHLYPLMAAKDPGLDITLITRSAYSPQKRGTWQGTKTVALYAPQFPGAEAAVHTFAALLYARFVLHPDLVHLHGIGPGFFTLMSKLLGFPTVVTHHANDFERPKWGLAGRIFLKTGERISARFADRLICVSEALRQSVAAKYPGAARRLVTIRNGGNVTDLNCENDSTILDRFGLTPGRYVVAVGRLEATKAFHELITAFEMADRDDIKLAVVGSGREGDSYLASLLARASDRVVFTGFQSGKDLEKLYREAALFVHPSHMEGFGLVVSEALSMNLPLAVSDIPPHREFGLPSHCYFRVGDVEAMVDILRSPDFSVFAAPLAVRHQRDNTWESSAWRHLTIFRSLQRAGSVTPAPRDDRTGASTTRKRVP
jgi:glycosyltransferase involved in cell wall biosynthesis